MRKTFAFAGVFALTAMASSPAAAQILDGSFETQGPAAIGSNPPGYCYGGGAPACAVDTPWFTASGGGLQDEANTAWPGTETPAGSYYAFMQNGGSVNQQFTADATGTFILEWLEAGRNNANFSGDQTYEVLLDGNPIFTGSTTSGQPFTAVMSDPFELVAGTLYSLSFHGTNFAGGDRTAYVDDVRLTAAGVPEPATWSMMLLGFGAAGFAMRRRREKLAAA